MAKEAASGGAGGAGSADGEAPHEKIIDGVAADFKKIIYSVFQDIYNRLLDSKTPGIPKNVLKAVEEFWKCFKTIDWKTFPPAVAEGFQKSVEEVARWMLLGASFTKENENLVVGALESAAKALNTEVAMNAAKGIINQKEWLIKKEVDMITICHPYDVPDQVKLDIRALVRLRILTLVVEAASLVAST